MVYPLERLYQEMSYLAYHFHWPYEQIMQMDHHERLRWVQEVSAINSQLNSPVQEVS